jgi:uracil-DNA glycosylase family 4
VEWREKVAREKRASFADEEYWGRPVPGFGDPDARVYVLGLAPAAHGGNRTGRVFTGDRSGDWLFASMYRTGFASQPQSVSADDGLELRGAFVGAAVRCAPPANKPLPAERDNCLPYAAEELRLISPAVIVCLGKFAWDAACLLHGVRPRPPFGHLAEFQTDRSWSARSTRASRTRSPGGSRSPCWTPSSPARLRSPERVLWCPAVRGR